MGEVRPVFAVLLNGDEAPLEIVFFVFDGITALDLVGPLVGTETLD